ncbi:MAG: class I fructose-bisphosphate aldolase family protein [Methanobacteriota archaeon]|nr:MAG: class I fructose-bisphosphate aldolase family protein [Euryarchaeota archaeon]
MTGKTIRLKRILDSRSGNTVIVPMDHGISLGPVKGIADIRSTVDKLAEGGASAVVVHKGLVPHLGPAIGAQLGLIVHLSASTSMSPDPNAKVLVAGVDAAGALGADAVSIHCNIGCDAENAMISDFGIVSDRCAELGLPLLAMTYPRGKAVKNQFDVEAVKHCARLSAELGADIVKTNYTGSADSFKEVVRGTPVPVVIAGGPKMDSDVDLLRMVGDAMAAGARGVSIGRNVFQHDDISFITRAIRKIVLEGRDPEDAYRR